LPGKCTEFDATTICLYTQEMMATMIPIVAILMVFGAPTYIVKRMLDLRARRLELESGNRKELESGAVKELEAMREENKLLEARIEAMEETILSGDFELNQKLKQIALAESDAPALPKGGKKKLGSGDS
jgi:hypothetical protein